MFKSFQYGKINVFVDIYMTFLLLVSGMIEHKNFKNQRFKINRVRLNRILLNSKVSNFINIIFSSENWSIKIVGINYSFFYNLLIKDYTSY